MNNLKKKLYVDIEGRVKRWFGMFLETQQGYYNFIHDVWGGK